VVIENGSGGTDLISIGIVDEGQSQYAAYAVPSGKTGFLVTAHVTTDGIRPADIRCFTRANLNNAGAPPFEPKLRQLYWDGITGEFLYNPKSPDFSIAGPGDIWFEAQAGASTEVSIDFEILLVDD
jgi:hypothetical protein